MQQTYIFVLLLVERGEIALRSSYRASTSSDSGPGSLSDGQRPVQSIAQALILVDGLMHEWIAILDEKQQGVMKEPHVPGARRLDLQRLEGVAVSFLCTNDAEVRRLALETLKTVRTLHRSLLASGEAPWSPRLPASPFTEADSRLCTRYTTGHWLRLVRYSHWSTLLEQCSYCISSSLLASSLFVNLNRWT